MADLDTVAVIAVGLTTLGVVLDWGVAPETKQRLQTKLEGLLYRFRYATWRKFGADEIAFSLRILDLFGRRFFSWRRLAVVVTLYATLAVALFLAVGPDTRGATILGDCVEISTSAVLFSISISYTLWLSRFVLRLPLGDTFIGTLLLLIWHIAILAAWRPLVEVLVAIPAMAVLGSLDPLEWLQVIVYRYKRYTSGLADVGLWELINIVFRVHIRTVLLAFDPPRAYLGPIIDFHLVIAVDEIASLLVNIFRIVLVLLFVFGFVWAKALRPILIWFWSGLIQSKAVFSPPLSALAAIIVAVDNRDAIIGALSRPFQ